MTKELQILIDHQSFMITKVEDNILIVNHKKGVITKDVFLEIVNYVKDYSKKNGGIYAVNTQDRGFSFDNETWRFIQAESHKYTHIRAHALVTKLLHFRILAKFHVKMSKNRGATSFKVVASVEDGLDWLKQRKEIDGQS